MEEMRRIVEETRKQLGVSDLSTCMSMLRHGSLVMCVHAGES